MSVAGGMVNAVAPVLPPKIAVMVTAPVATDEAFPIDPAALLIVATDVFEEPQVADVVRSCVVLSEYVPVAANC
jgi:hypothetical protein